MIGFEILFDHNLNVVENRRTMEEGMQMQTSVSGETEALEGADGNVFNKCPGEVNSDNIEGGNTNDSNGDPNNNDDGGHNQSGNTGSGASSGDDKSSNDDDEECGDSSDADDEGSGESENEDDDDDTDTDTYETSEDDEDEQVPIRTPEGLDSIKLDVFLADNTSLDSNANAVTANGGTVLNDPPTGCSNNVGKADQHIAVKAGNYTSEARLNVGFDPCATLLTKENVVSPVEKIADENSDNKGISTSAPLSDGNVLFELSFQPAAVLTLATPQVKQEPSLKPTKVNINGNEEIGNKDDEKPQQRRRSFRLANAAKGSDSSTLRDKDNVKLTTEQDEVNQKNVSPPPIKRKRVDNRTSTVESSTFTSNDDDNKSSSTPRRSARRSLRVVQESVDAAQTLKQVDDTGTGDDSEDTTCEECGKHLSNAANLRRHLKLHSDPECQYICKFCNKRFREKYNVVRHMVVIHSPLGKTFKCPFCPTVFTLKADLRDHIPAAHNDCLSV